MAVIVYDLVANGRGRYLMACPNRLLKCPRDGFVDLDGPK